MAERLSLYLFQQLNRVFRRYIFLYRFDYYRRRQNRIPLGLFCNTGFQPVKITRNGHLVGVTGTTLSEVEGRWNPFYGRVLTNFLLRTSSVDNRSNV